MVILEDLMQNKLKILSNAKLVGPANSLNNTNYEPGDIRMVGGDGKTIFNKYRWSEYK